jgi:hypothetical protein
LCTAAEDDYFLAFEFVHSIAELGFVHEAAFAELVQLQAQGQCIEVIHCGSPGG